MRLSARSAWPSEPSTWARAVAHARATSPDLVDLTPSNPTQVGLVHPEPVYRALGDPQGARYEPHPLGLPVARDAVAAYYARRGQAVDPARLWLCASTSEAYAQLLTLLADPGDTVLVPSPGYPLLDMLGDLAGVRRVPYPLRRDGRWFIDLDGLDRALARSPRARVLVVIAPGNPTGAMLDPAQWHALQARARAHDLALVVDEVFADYPLDPPPDRLRFVGDDDAPCLVLSGLSKVAALPQLKLSWVVMHGPETTVAPLRTRAELVDDALLSVATPVQRALPTLLAAARAHAAAGSGSGWPKTSGCCAPECGISRWICCPPTGAGPRCYGCRRCTSWTIWAGRSACCGRACWCSRGSCSICRPRRGWPCRC